MGFVDLSKPGCGGFKPHWRSEEFYRNGNRGYATEKWYSLCTKLPVLDKAFLR